MMVHPYLISRMTNYQKVTGDFLKNVQFDKGGEKRKQVSVLIFSPAIIFEKKKTKSSKPSIDKQKRV